MFDDLSAKYAQEVRTTHIHFKLTGTCYIDWLKPLVTVDGPAAG